MASTYDDYPAPDFPSSSPSRNAGKAKASGRASADRPSDSGYGGSTSSRKPSEDRRRPSETEFTAGRKSEDTYRRPDDVFAGRIIGEESFSAALASRRKPSQDTTRKPDEREFGPRHSGAVSTSSETTSNFPSTQSTTATSAVIIPNKSTMEEEYIDIPYGRDGRESGTTIPDERERTRDGIGGDSEQDTPSEYPSPMMNSQSSLVGLSGLSARLKGVEDDNELPAGNKSSDDLSQMRFLFLYDFQLLASESDVTNQYELAHPSLYRKMKKIYADSSILLGDVDEMRVRINKWK